MNTIKRLAFATNNKHKIIEVQNLIENKFQLLSASDLGCTDDIPEEQDTLQGNALQKAQYIYDRYKMPCFADDTGLEVEALNGAPGVYSARYAGINKSYDDNNNKLIAELLNKDNRKACFRCVIALIDNKGNKHLFEGKVEGTISNEYRGNGGFGYDPLFIPDGYNVSFAEISLDQKNKISHRGKAVDALVKWLIENSNLI